MKILIVEDSRTMRNLQRGILGQMGFMDIEEAIDGIDAVERLEQVRPDLILVDWNMPRMNGVALVRRIRADGNPVPIIMVTMEADQAKVIEAIKAGVDNYVVKPFTPDVLNQRIQETLEQTCVS